MPVKLHETEKTERAVLAQLIHGRMDPEEAADSFAELARLADTAGIEAVGQLVQRRPKPDGGTLLGDGKVDDLHTLQQTSGADTIIFDNELTAIQAHNLQARLQVRVMDRREVILQIFARRARTSEAQIQVELAQTEFALSRIPVLEAQQRFRAGTGMRGPGESHLQLRNEPLRRRIADLRAKLEAIERREAGRKTHRDFPLVCLIGYTNAGKSTLLNTLSGSDAYVDDRLFATLDTKTRLAWLAPGRRVLLSDTVGFIRNLPHGLVASFRSTLAVASQADLLIITVDASHPHVENHIAVCYETLREIGADKVPGLLVLNKCDQPDAAEATLHHLAPLHEAGKLQFCNLSSALPVSAKTGYGLDTLKQAIIQELNKCSTSWQLPSAISPTSHPEL